MNYHEEQIQGNLDERGQATEEEFLMLLALYLGWAMHDNLEPVLHVFTNNRDVWFQDTRLAFETYQNWVERYNSARLYIELYINRENDEMEHEDCLLSHGDFPM